MDGTPRLAVLAESRKGMRQIAQGRFLFLWTLRSETPFFSEMIKNGLGHEVRDEGGQSEGRRDREGWKKTHKSVRFGL